MSYYREKVEDIKIKYYLKRNSDGKIVGAEDEKGNQNFFAAVEHDLSKLNSASVLTPDGTELYLHGSRRWDHLPRFALIGDSTIAKGTLSSIAGTMTASGSTVTVVTNSVHNLYKGASFLVQNATPADYNGWYTMASYISTTSFTYTLPAAASAGSASAEDAAGINIITQQVSTEANFSQLSNFLAGHKGLFIGNFSQGGSKTSHLDRQLDLALDSTKNPYGLAPDIIFISTGINDVLNDVAIATTKTNITNAITRIVATGAVPVLLTTMPVDNTYGAYSVARVGVARTLNAWERQYVPAMGAILIDANEVCSDPANQYGNWKTNYSYDGLHINDTAAFQIAKSIKTAVWDEIDTVVDTRTITDITPNPTLTGTSGTLGNATVTGSVANSAQVTSSGDASRTTVCAKGLALSGNGESQRLTITAAAANDSFNFIMPVNVALISAGDKLIARCRIRTESDMTPVANVEIHIGGSIDGVTPSWWSSSCAFDGSAPGYSWVEKFDMTMETPVTYVPDATIANFQPVINIRFRAAGTVIIDISDFAIFKIS